MDDQALMEGLREKHPGAFEGWDEFEVTITMRSRKGEIPRCLVTLYNKGSDGYVVDLHNCLLLISDDDGRDVIDIGRDLRGEFESAYYPGDDG